MTLELDTIICGDNISTMATLPDACIDLVVTSPPYDNLRTYGGHSWDFEGVAQQLWRVIKPGGVVVWVVADATVNGSETGTSFRQALRFMEIGFRLHDTMIYEKDTIPFPESNRYEQAAQFMFVFSVNAPATFNPLREKTKGYGSSSSSSARQSDGTVEKLKYATGLETRKRFNIWRFGAGYMKSTKDVVAFSHPATFPEALARDHILSWSNEGDIVLDPFNGSGTTTKMARWLGRRFIGIEVNQAYCDIAWKRLSQQLFEFEPIPS